MNIEVSDIALKIGTLLNEKYLIDEVHYLGNYGIVYFGTDREEKIDIVIKEFMPYKLANRDLDGKSVVCKSPGLEKAFFDARNSFARECQYVRRLKNLSEPYEECIVQYVDSFTENDTIYLITERIYGKSLQEYMDGSEVFSIEEKMSMLIDIIQSIHKEGYIHCDIKPSNVLIREDGKVVLIDFGSACEEKNKELHHAFVSRGFSAPELYLEEEVDRRTDIYSVGATMYYLYTGYRLPASDDYDDEEEVPRISEFTDISYDLEEMILQMLSRQKNKRPDSLLQICNIVNKKLMFQ